MSWKYPFYNYLIKEIFQRKNRLFFFKWRPDVQSRPIRLKHFMLARVLIITLSYKNR